MSHVYINIGDWEKVKFFRKKSTEMNPLVNLNIWDYILQGQFQEAIDIEESRPFKNEQVIGECYLMLGRYDSAYLHLKKLEEKRKKNNPENYTPLDELNIAENTIVIFTSDNGPESSAMPHKAKYGRVTAVAAGPFQGIKRS